MARADHSWFDLFFLWPHDVRTDVVQSFPVPPLSLPPTDLSRPIGADRPRGDGGLGGGGGAGDADAGPVAGLDPSDLVVTVDGLVDGETVLGGATAGLDLGSPLLGRPGSVPLAGNGVPIPGGSVDVSGHVVDVGSAGVLSAALRDEIGPLLGGFSSAGAGLPSATAGGPSGAGPGVAIGRSELSARAGRGESTFEAPDLPALDASTGPASLTEPAAGARASLGPSGLGLASGLGTGVGSGRAGQGLRGGSQAVGGRLRDLGRLGRRP